MKINKGKLRFTPQEELILGVTSIISSILLLVYLFFMSVATWGLSSVVLGIIAFTTMLFIFGIGTITNY